jgi:tripartite-type tricarboxylate transporter receptor subunit TctC
VALPDIPTVDEFPPGYEASLFYGVGAPKNTPAEIIEKLNKEINAGLADPKMKTRLVDLGGTVREVRFSYPFATLMSASGH